MNRYGRLAHDHWKATDPARFGAIRNPKEFFSTLGETVEAQIQALQPRLAGPDPAAGETLPEKMGRANMARLQAEEMVLADLVWLTPPQGEESPEAEDPGPLYLTRQAGWEAQNEGQDSY